MKSRRFTLQAGPFHGTNLDFKTLWKLWPKNSTPEEVASLHTAVVCRGHQKGLVGPSSFTLACGIRINVGQPCLKAIYIRCLSCTNRVGS